MGAEKNIVAIELGSSSVRAIVGQKKADGSLQIVGFEKESAPDITLTRPYRLFQTSRNVLKNEDISLLSVCAWVLAGNHYGRWLMPYIVSSTSR